MLGDLGGITALMVFFIGGLVQTMSNFIIDNSMISNIYTIPKVKQNSQKTLTNNEETPI